MAMARVRAMTLALARGRMAMAMTHGRSRKKKTLQKKKPVCPKKVFHPRVFIADGLVTQNWAT